MLLIIDRAQRLVKCHRPTRLIRAQHPRIAGGCILGPTSMATGKSAMPRRTQRQGRPSALSRVSVSQLITEIKSRRDIIALELQAINTELADLGSAEVAETSFRRGPGRPKGSRNGVARSAGRGAKGHGRGGNKPSLPTLLHSLLRGKTMSVPEMAAAAKKAGHKTKSKSFRTIVSLALLNNKPMFKRVSRGQYTAK